jgi:hypothetical protein
LLFVSVFKIIAGLSAPSGWRAQLCSLGYGRQSHHLAGVSNPASREVNGQTFTPSGWRAQLCSLGYGRQSHHLAGVSNPASREVNGQTFTPSGWRSVRLFPDHNPRLGWHTGLRLRHGNSRGDDKSLNIFSSRSKSAASGEARNGLKSFFIFFAGLSAPSGWRFDVNDLVWLCDTDL